jgi:hypothetical protein
MGWFVCVLGGDLSAVIYTVVLLTLHIYFFVEEKKEYLVIILFPALGMLGESFLILKGWHFSGISFIPPWLACLWILMSMTLFHSLRWLGSTPFLAIVLSFIAPAVSYYTGGKLIGLVFTSPVTSLGLISLLWLLLLPGFIYYARKKYLPAPINNPGPTKSMALLAVLVPLTFAMRPIDTVDANSELEPKPYVVGIAKGLDDDSVIYQELHFKHPNNIEEVRYLSPDNTVIAVKFIDYNKSLINPGFKQENMLSNETSKAHWENSQLQVSFGKKNEIPDIVILDEFKPDDENLVIDAGFDNFIRKNWNSLLQGERIEYNFLLASRLTTFSMRVKKTDCRNNETILNGPSLSGKKAFICFTTVLGNPFLRLITDPIYLKYNSASKSLFQFVGIGNINNEKGDTYHVNIIYTYNLSSPSDLLRKTPD